MNTHFLIADYRDSRHAEAIVDLLDEYASDPIGGGRPLAQRVRDNLVASLEATPGAFSVLGLQNEQPVALANCFRGLSTFACRPLINIHDLVVSSDARGTGVSQLLMAFIEREGHETRCCKITLEVVENNEAALAAYGKFGFEPYSLGRDTGRALFMQKLLQD